MTQIRAAVCRNHPDREVDNVRGKYAYLCAECRAAKRGLRSVPEPAPVEPEPVELDMAGAGPLLQELVAAQPAFELAQEAAEVVKARMGSYGPPDENHGCTAVLWGAYLERRRQACDRRGETFVLDGQDVCWLNVLQKVSREANARGGDNRLDVMGFAINAEIIVRSVP